MECLCKRCFEESEKRFLQVWNDYQLQWDEADYGGISVLRYKNFLKLINYQTARNNHCANICMFTIYSISIAIKYN